MIWQILGTHMTIGHVLTFRNPALAFGISRPDAGAPTFNAHALLR
jgi:hypothetical protein